MDRFADIGVQVHRIDKVHIWIFCRQILNGCAHADESVSEIFTSVSGYQNEFLAISKP